MEVWCVVLTFRQEMARVSTLPDFSSSCAWLLLEMLQSSCCTLFCAKLHFAVISTNRSLDSCSKSMDDWNAGSHVFRVLVLCTVLSLSAGTNKFRFTQSAHTDSDGCQNSVLISSLDTVSHTSAHNVCPLFSLLSSFGQNNDFRRHMMCCAGSQSAVPMSDVFYMHIPVLPKIMNVSCLNRAMQFVTRNEISSVDNVVKFLISLKKTHCHVNCCTGHKMTQSDA